MKAAVELVRGLPRKELIERIYFHHHQGEVAERALAFYLLQMQEGGTYQPLKDAATWASVNLGRERADKLILVARRLEDLPEIDAALAAGEVVWSKVREIARVATRATEGKWLHLARTATAREVEEAVARAKLGDEPGGGLKARRPRYTEKLQFSGEEKAVWDQGIRKVLSELPKGATPSRAAAEMARRALLTDPEGNVPGRKAHGRGAFLVVLHRGKNGAAWADAAEGRVEVDPATIDEMVREGARVIEVRDIEGAGECEAIRFGERGKVAPEDRDDLASPEQKEAVLSRDGRCLVCGSVEDLTPHHLDSHADGGRSVEERMACLCVRCQGQVHDQDIILRVEEDGSITPLDRDRSVIGKARSALEVLGGAGEQCPLETFVTSGAPATERPAGTPEPDPFDALPAEMTAAEWRALEGRCEWSGSRRAFIFHPEWPETATEASRPIEAPRTEGSLRPVGFEEFVGQRAVVEDLLLAGRAARQRGEPLGHVLLGGQPGLGKTSLCRLLAREFGTGLVEVVAGNIGDPHQLVSILTRLQKGEFLFFDEIHRLPAICEESLYSALEDGTVSAVLSEGCRTRTVKIRLEPFTLVAATTRVGALSAPFRGRFKHNERLEPYAEEEIAEVVSGAAARLGTGVSPEAALEIARRSRGTPREAVRILDRARDVAQLSGVTCIDLAHVGQAAERLGIDEHGLDRVERAAVKLLVERGRPLGREALAARLGVDLETYRDVHEPWLERSDLIERTEAGRVATPKAKALYGGCREERERRIAARKALEELVPELWLVGS
jgi:Holliday junction DNA helicase RuvB